MSIPWTIAAEVALTSLGWWLGLRLGRRWRLLGPQAHGQLGALPDIRRALERKIERNAPCPCGSGRKAKRCCLSGRTAALGIPSSDKSVRLRRFRALIMQERARFPGEALINEVDWIASELDASWVHANEGKAS